MNTESAEKPLRERVADLFLSRSIDDLIGYGELAEIGCDCRKARSPVYHARTVLLQDRGLTFRVVPREGYKIIHPDQSPAVVRGRLRKARKQYRLAGQVAEKSDRSLMSGATRQEMEGLQVAITGLRRDLDSVIKQQNFTQRVLEDHTQKIDRLEEARLQLTANELAFIKRLAAREQRAGTVPDDAEETIMVEVP